MNVEQNRAMLLLIRLGQQRQNAFQDSLHPKKGKHTRQQQEGLVNADLCLPDARFGQQNTDQDQRSVADQLKKLQTGNIRQPCLQLHICCSLSKPQK